MTVRRRVFEELPVLPHFQVVIDADTRLAVTVGKLVPGNRNDPKAFAESGADATRALMVFR